MKTLMRALFVMAMALALFSSVGVSYASGPAYDDFINGAPTASDVHTPDVMGSLQ